jgi:hypothetical protein
LQEVYAQHLGRDDSGAIAAFLDDAGVMTLQVCCCSVVLSTNLIVILVPVNVAMAVSTACSSLLARSEYAQASGFLKSCVCAHANHCLCQQASVAKSPAGQLQIRLSNSTDFPQACYYQVCRLNQQGTQYCSNLK